ncbi:MAG: FAD-dependent oxidoreductase [Pseudolysinimonas sp.]
MPERIVLVGFGPVGARFAEELLPAVSSGLVSLTVVGAEPDHAYNRVLLADYAVGSAGRDALEMTDTSALDGAGVRILTGTSVVTLNRTTNTVTLDSGERVPYDRLVLATGARANIPTLDGVTRLRRDRMRPPDAANGLDTADARLPIGITALRDLDDARRVLDAIQAGRRIIVLGAGVLGMELALAAAHAGAETAVVYHSESPMDRNLDVGGGAMLARAARHAGVTMINHSRAESVVCHVDEHGDSRFDAIICADGKQIDGDLLVLSCGVGARVELAYLAGLDVAGGVLVDDQLRTWADDDIYAIGDCAHVATRSADGSLPDGGPTGLIGPGWRQADWLAARFVADFTAGHSIDAPGFVDRGAGVVMLKAEGVDVVAAGAVKRDIWEIDLDEGRDHASGCEVAAVQVAQWADPEHGRYVKMVSRAGILEGFVSVGMPRTAAELTLLFERRSELPADRSVLLRFDGPDYVPSAARDAFALDATVCWCNGVTVGEIAGSAAEGNTTIECISSATRAGTGCGGCKGRIADVLDFFARAEPETEPQEA